MISLNAVYGRDGDDMDTWPLQDRDQRGWKCVGGYNHVLQAREPGAETNWKYNAWQRDISAAAIAKAVTEVPNMYSIAWVDTAYNLYHTDPNKLDAERYAQFCAELMAATRYIHGYFLDYAPKSRCEVWGSVEDNFPVYCPKNLSEQRSRGEVQFRSWLRRFLEHLGTWSDQSTQNGDTWRVLNGKGAEQADQYSDRGLCEAVYYENVTTSKAAEYRDNVVKHGPDIVQMFAPKTANDFALARELVNLAGSGLLVWDQNLTGAP